MAKYYQDFVGLNTFIYEPNGYNVSASQQFSPSVYSFGREAVSHIDFFGETAENYIYFNQNFIGADLSITPTGFRTTDLAAYKNYHFSHELSNTASFFNALMSKRNGPYGYPMWKQIRTGQNPLSRKQRRENVFTYVTEPGTSRDVTIGGRTNQITDRYGAINVFTEPVVNASHKPLELYGGVSVYDASKDKEIKHSVRLKTSFGSQMVFFANDEPNRYYDLVFETDENYENLKKLYLKDALGSDSSPMDRFTFLSYKQQIWPKQEYAFLDKTRSRTFFVNTFWRDVRTSRTETNVSNGQGVTVPFQSMWPLDAAADFETRSEPNLQDNVYAAGNNHAFYYYVGGVSGSGDGGSSGKTLGGFNTGQDTESGTAGTPNASLGGSGVLCNSYSQVMRGNYIAGSSPGSVSTLNGITDPGQALSSSCYYARRHTLNSITSVVGPSGMQIVETGSQASISTGSLFEGIAAWDAGKQAGKNPFYDSYEDYNQNIRLKGQGYSIVPEFRISSHVKTYQSKGVTEELKEIFELSGALGQNTTTSGSSTFYKVLSNSEFLKHFDLIKKDHEDFANPISIALRCKAVKKFLPYEGFYPAQRCVNLSQQFYDSYGDKILTYINGAQQDSSDNFAVQSIIEPLFAPGILFNTIKSGVACDYPIILSDDIHTGKVSYLGKESNKRINYLITGSDYALDHDQLYSAFIRVPFEAIVEPERFLAGRDLRTMGPHPFELAASDISAQWSGDGDLLYKKMANNFLAESTEFFLKNGNMTTITSLPSENPAFGNAESGSFYAMRVKMRRTRNKPNDFLPGFGADKVIPPQDLYPRFDVRENFTMYSRPSAFSPPTWGGDGTGSYGTTNQFTINGSDSMWGYNFPYTAPYYHGEGWADLIFRPSETKKYTVDEIIASASLYPYYTRFWWNGTQDALRDLSGYSGSEGTALPWSQPLDIAAGAYTQYDKSPWFTLISSSANIIQGEQMADTQNYAASFNWGDGLPFASNYPTRVAYANYPSQYAIQHPYYINYNAMQMNSSVNLFGKGTARVITSEEGDEQIIDINTEATSGRKTRWIIQPKFETPMLNFNSYTDLTADPNLTCPTFASESVPRGMWHQYGQIEEDPSRGVFLEISDIPPTWWKGALGVNQGIQNKYIKSLADLCGFSKEPVRLGEVGQAKEISEAVVAVPFIEQDGTRKFFSLPRIDITTALDRIRNEKRMSFVEPPNVGDTVLEMVRNMQKYVFPPSMDFVKNEEIDPFAMYIFEFKHVLDKQDLADMWQNLPPKIGRSFEEAEATIGHPLVAEELLGGGAVIQADKIRKNIQTNLDSKIQWMIFKAKKRARTNYFDKVVAKKGGTMDSSVVSVENSSTSELGDDMGVTYNWPYDFFSLVELVKIDAEVNLGNLPPPVDNNIMQEIAAEVPNSVKQKAITNPTGLMSADNPGSLATNIAEQNASTPGFSEAGSSGEIDPSDISGPGGGSGPGFNSGGGGFGF
tara:strand:+ start:1462 stop:5886 length:4425 start_codon:yes stop_codon:yes gene_type:complete